MRLESIYIENFGGLHQFALKLESGLTVIHAPNGYGKTTLAEFIRAMFYGFPRKGKTLEKSRRQKYTPWQGGKFGGSLIFEFEGKRYRLERTFGATPRGDTFALYDLETGSKSDRFTEEIGLELFRLDGDSFERSTYMPQMRDQGELTTDSIQAKLTNLVEDPDDLGNFDRAMATLRIERSGLIPYRGSGGTVAKARMQISLLNAELDTLNQKVKEVEKLQLQIQETEKKLKNIRNESDEIRSQLEEIGSQALAAAASRELETLLEQERQILEELQKLEIAYPQGIPSAPELEQAMEAAERRAFLRGNRQQNGESQAARKILEENRIFETRLPRREELEECRGHITACQACRARVSGAGLSPEEQQRYAQLLQMERLGVLDPDRVEDLTERVRKLDAAELELTRHPASGEEQETWRSLSAYFRGDPPGEKVIQKYRQMAETAERMRREGPAGLIEAAVAVPSPVVPILMLIMSLIGIGAGAWLLWSGLQIWGVAAIAAGFGLLTAGTLLAMQRKKRVDEELHRRGRNDRLHGEWEDTLARMEQQMSLFARQYTQTQPASRAIREIGENWDAYYRLNPKITAAAVHHRLAAEERDRLREMLQRELGTGDPKQEILQLHLAGAQLASLRKKAEAAEAEMDGQLRDMKAHHAAAVEFLKVYFQNPDGDLHGLLDELQRRVAAYEGARSTVELQNQRSIRNNREADAAEAELTAFFEKFRLQMPEDPGPVLVKIRDDRRDYEQLQQRLASQRRSVQACRDKNRDALTLRVSLEAQDPEPLRREERRLGQMAEAVSEHLQQQRQQLRGIREQTEKLSDVQQELEFWNARHQEDRKKAFLLDDTMACLERARGQLQQSYMGPLRQAFSGYMEKMLGEEGAHILLTTDFQVRLERYGAARELGFFSAGQEDLVMLCMRLALVDALFTAEKPFVILDDPFVNLDDAHTRQAVELLRDLAQNRQIIYLVCNSSRDPATM